MQLFGIQTLINREPHRCPSSPGVAAARFFRAGTGPSPRRSGPVLISRTAKTTNGAVDQCPFICRSNPGTGDAIRQPPPPQEAGLHLLAVIITGRLDGWGDFTRGPWAVLSSPEGGWGLYLLDIVYLGVGVIAVVHGTLGFILQREQAGNTMDWWVLRTPDWLTDPAPSGRMGRLRDRWWPSHRPADSPAEHSPRCVTPAYATNGAEGYQI